MSKEALEKEKILKVFEHLDLETLKPVFQAVSMFKRATEGKEIEPEDVISKLINVRNILERSRFPTYPLLGRNVYLRLIKAYAPEAESCERWANLEAEALTSYKGASRQEYVDMTKAQALPPEQQMFFGQRQLEQPQKKRFWQRKPSKEVTEFSHD